MAAAAISAPITSAITEAIASANDTSVVNGKIDTARMDVGQKFSVAFWNGAATSFASQTISLAVNGGGKFNWTAVASDAFGNAIGESLAARNTAAQLDAKSNTNANSQADAQSRTMSVDEFMSGWTPAREYAADPDTDSVQADKPSPVARKAKPLSEQEAYLASLTQQKKAGAELSRSIRNGPEKSYGYTGFNKEYVAPVPTSNYHTEIVQSGDAAGGAYGGGTEQVSVSDGPSMPYSEQMSKAIAATPVILGLTAKNAGLGVLQGTYSAGITAINGYRMVYDQIANDGRSISSIAAEDTHLVSYDRGFEGFGIGGEAVSLGAWSKVAKLGTTLLLETRAARYSTMQLEGAANSAVNPLRAGQLHEAEQLAKLGVDKNTLVFRPTQEQIDSAAFKVIVGDAKYTKGGQVKGTIFDGVSDTGYLEIKGGRSELNSTYQLRLQTYKSLVDNKPLTIQTTRPVNPEFQKWLDSWGVKVVKPGG